MESQITFLGMAHAAAAIFAAFFGFAPQLSFAMGGTVRLCDITKTPLDSLASTCYLLDKLWLDIATGLADHP